MFLVVVAAVGWLVGLDPAPLASALAAAAGAVGLAEGSNVGKRATTKVELMDGADAAPETEIV